IPFDVQVFKAIQGDYDMIISRDFNSKYNIFKKYTILFPDVPLPQNLLIVSTLALLATVSLMCHMICHQLKLTMIYTIFSEVLVKANKLIFLFKMRKDFALN
ncbi:hypothetical protein HK096_009694, partial [Nowakowskiella sp. JEL0078]